MRRMLAVAVVLAGYTPSVSAQSGSIAITPGPKAPFSRIQIDIDPDACGRLGCEIAIRATSRTGKSVDVTFQDVMTNGFLGKPSEVFGYLDPNGMPIIVLEQGLVNGGNSFNLFKYDALKRRYVFQGTVDSYAAGKRGASKQGQSPIAVVDKQPTRLTGLIYYEGVSTTDGKQKPAEFGFEVEGSTLGGYWRDPTSPIMVGKPIQGTYVDGVCTTRVRGDTYTGKCDETGFTGQRLDKKTGQIVGTFSLRTVGYKPTGSTQTPAAYQSAGSIQRSYVAVWTLGRVRFLSERGERCSAEAALGKPFCFEPAIEWLEKRPDKREVDVITTDASYRLGTYIPLNNGQGWDVYRVSRRGSAFVADKQLHFATKVSTPNGCLVRGIINEGWFISSAQGRKVAVEAKLYACEAWTSNPVVSQYIDYQYVDANRLEFGDISSLNQIATRATASGNSLPQDVGANAHRQNEQTEGCCRPNPLLPGIEAIHRRNMQDLQNSNSYTAPPPTVEKKPSKRR